MVKFISLEPYQFISFRQIPNYPITMFNQNSGVQFDGGEFVTEDKALIAGLRDFIRNFERASSLEANKKFSFPCPITEYGKTIITTKYVPPAPEPNNDNSGISDEAIRKIRDLLRL